MKPRRDEAATPQRSWVSTIGMGLLLLLPVIAYRWWNHAGVLVGLAMFYVVLALWLRSRLLICSLAGLVFGAMLIDSESRDQSETYRVWQPVWALGVGLLIGILIGFIWDRAQNFEDKPMRRAPKKRR